MANNEVVTIGCRLPNGYELEVGYQITETDPLTKREFTLYKKHTNYRRHVLKGTHAHNADLLRRGIRLPGQRDPQPFINRNVPKDLWDEWLKQHPNSPMVKHRLIFEVKGGTQNEQAVMLDAMSAGTAPFQPLDQNAPVTVGGNVVEKAAWE